MTLSAETPESFLWDDPNGYNYGAFLKARQRETSPMMWAALYQQRPAPEDGDYFKAAWLKTCDALPARETMRVYGGSDYAVTADGGDYTVHIVLGLDPDGRMYLLDRWRNSHHPTNGSRPFAIWCRYGSRWAGLRRRGRSAPVSVRPSIGGKGSGKPIVIGSNFPLGVTKASELNRSAAGWHWRGFTS